jgi:hypothetical protein
MPIIGGQSTPQKKLKVVKQPKLGDFRESSTATVANETMFTKARTVADTGVDKGSYDTAVTNRKGQTSSSVEELKTYDKTHPSAKTGGGGGGGKTTDTFGSTKTGKWAGGAVGQWKTGATGKWSGGVTGGGGGGGGFGGIGKTGTAAAKNDQAQVDRVRKDSGFSGMHGGYATESGGAAGGGGTGSPYAPGLSEVVKSTGVKSTEQLKGISVEETVKGARRTKKTGQKRSL